MYVFIIISVYPYKSCIFLRHHLHKNSPAAACVAALRARCLQTSFRWGHPSMPSNPAGGVRIPDSAHG